MQLPRNHLNAVFKLTSQHDPRNNVNIVCQRHSVLILLVVKMPMLECVQLMTCAFPMFAPTRPYFFADRGSKAEEDHFANPGFSEDVFVHFPIGYLLGNCPVSHLFPSLDIFQTYLTVTVVIRLKVVKPWKLIQSQMTSDNTGRNGDFMSYRVIPSGNQTWQWKIHYEWGFQ